MSFNEINPDTGRSWTRAELYEALEDALDDKDHLMLAINHYDNDEANENVEVSVMYGNV